MMIDLVILPYMSSCKETGCFTRVSWRKTAPALGISFRRPLPTGSQDHVISLSFLHMAQNGNLRSETYEEPWGCWGTRFPDKPVFQGAHDPGCKSYSDLDLGSLVHASELTPVVDCMDVH